MTAGVATALAAAALAHPGLRLGQLIDNALDASPMAGIDLFYVDDVSMESALVRYAHSGVRR